MNGVLYAAFLMAVGIGILGCIAYLIATRKSASRATIPQSNMGVGALSQEFGGEYRLAELGSILGRLAAAEKWGAIVLLNFASTGWRFVDMSLYEDSVCVNNNDLHPDFPERFRRAAVSNGLRVQEVNEYFGTVEKVGTFQETGDHLARLIAEVRSIRLDEVAKVSVDQ